MSLTEIGTYTSITEANLVKARLLTFDIESVVEGDAASGSIPTIEALTGVKVLVRSEDHARAMEALGKMLSPPDQES